jgi:hypothetical protein
MIGIGSSMIPIFVMTLIVTAETEAASAFPQTPSIVLSQLNAKGLQMNNDSRIVLNPQAPEIAIMTHTATRNDSVTNIRWRKSKIDIFIVTMVNTYKHSITNPSCGS